VIVVTGNFRLPNESRQAGREAMGRIIEASRAEPGCIAYAYAEDVSDPGLFRVSEAWVSREALAAHLDTPNMQLWRQERAALGMTERQVTAYEVTGEERL